MKNLQKTLETFISKLVDMPIINPIKNLSNTTLILNTIIMTEKLKYPQEYIETFEKISKFYDYKSNTTILRTEKSSIYPRYICTEKANPLIGPVWLNLKEVTY